ncbi:hypothetical protein [Halogranum amylolyticum]|uniref:hypothetical protein n=1 Tax=Halogranum amylolyticum TaxID=660520 RepID=UPI000AEB3327|nr:hypothetical protein [Halogranum amylolyticum]
MPTRGVSLTLAETPFEEREFTRLWFAATATYGVGDVVTTIAIIQFGTRVAEGNALLASVVDVYGQAGLVGLKLVAFFVCIGVSLLGADDADRLLYYLPPVLLTFVGAFFTVYNLRLLLG